MAFISIGFAVLTGICFILYYMLPARCRKYVLLAASCIFVGYSNTMFLAAAVSVSIFTYCAGIILDSGWGKRRQDIVFWSSVGLLLFCWTGFRYAGTLTGWTGIIFPLGISFYTFQAVSYLTEIYWGEEKAERDLPAFMLYMMLFMKFLAGPIERPSDLLPQIRKGGSPSYGMMSYGMKLIVVGLFKKLALADHIAPYIDNIFASAHTASGVQLLMASLLYPIELYADFSGYTDMAIGTAMLFGIRLSDNFRQPFFACTTADFWRRWHMSLSFWVRDYIYVPLTSVTRGWGHWGVAMSLITTFVILGIWHGAGWTFVIYGLIQGIVILWETHTSGTRNRVRELMGGRIFSAVSAVRTYLIFAFSLIFFRSPSVRDALYFISNISFRADSSWKEMNIGMSDHVCIVAGAALVLMWAYDFFMSRNDLLEKLGKSPAPVRWAVYYLVTILILAYGKIGTENFIYLQF